MSFWELKLNCFVYFYLDKSLECLSIISPLTVIIYLSLKKSSPLAVKLTIAYRLLKLGYWSASSHCVFWRMWVWQYLKQEDRERIYWTFIKSCMVWKVWLRKIYFLRDRGEGRRGHSYKLFQKGWGWISPNIASQIECATHGTILMHVRLTLRVCAPNSNALWTSATSTLLNNSKDGARS